jgi:hypothetical protein
MRRLVRGYSIRLRSLAALTRRDDDSGMGRVEKPIVSTPSNAVSTFYTNLADGPTAGRGDCRGRR